jgi:hypothetical protein
MSCGGTTGTSLCDALCIGAASLEAVARSGSWGQSMAVQGDRIYILEQATTQMKITPKRRLGMQKCFRYRWLCSPWGPRGRFYFGKFNEDVDKRRSGPSRPAERALVIVRPSDHETQGRDVPCSVAIDSAGEDTWL